MQKKEKIVPLLSSSSYKGRVRKGPRLFLGSRGERRKKAEVRYSNTDEMSDQH